MNERAIGCARQALVLCVALPFLAACSSSTGPEPSPTKTPAAAAATTPTALSAAHQAYLDGDYLAVGERIHDVLLDATSSDLAKENAYELLEKAYETQHGALPSNFKVPAGFDAFEYGYIRYMTPRGPHYEVHFRGVTRDASKVKGLTIRRLPGETLLDKATGKGQFVIRRDPAGAKHNVEEFILNSGPIEKLPADGVVSIRIELEDGTVSEGFVIAHGLASTASPEIASPGSSDSVADANPKMTWAPFRSPQFAGSEHRSVVVHLVDERNGKMVWEFATDKPDAVTSVKLGSNAGVPETQLAPGNYWLSLTEGEVRQFGPVGMLRLSRTGQPFHVVRH